MFHIPDFKSINKRLQIPREIEHFIRIGEMGIFILISQLCTNQI